MKADLLAKRIYDYLEGNYSLSFQIKGQYGKGKTYFVKEKLPQKLKYLKREEKNLKSEYERIQILISLYDLQNIKEIPAKLLNAFIKSKSENIDEYINRGYDYLEKKYGRGNAISNFSIDNDAEVIFNIIPKDSVYICLDDVSHFLRKDNTEDFLGFVNELVENWKYKVILIWNDSDDKNTDDYKKYVEKIIGWSVEYEASIEDVVKSFSEEMKDDDFKEYIKDKIKYFLPESYQDIPRRTFFENLRSLRFALYNFYDVFKLYKDNLLDEKVQWRLEQCLLFTIGVSLEFKAGMLSKYNKRDIDIYPDVNVGSLNYNVDDLDTFFRDEPQLFKGNHEPENEKKSDYDYSMSFYKFYLDVKFNQIYIFHPQLYNHIIAGDEIDKEELEKKLEEKDPSNFINDKLRIPKDGNSIVDCFLRQIWMFSDEEFKDTLNKLKEETENGNLRGFNYFINATIYLYGYGEIIGLNEGELKKIVEKGLDSFISKENITVFDESILDAMESNVPNDCKWVIDLIKEKLKLKKSNDDQNNFYYLVETFKSDIVTFSKNLMQEGQYIPPYAFVPILKDFPVKAIDEGINNITPEEVVKLRSLAKFRNDAGLIESENQFWKDVNRSLRNYVKSHNSSLTRCLIERDLLPYLENKLGISVENP